VFSAATLSALLMFGVMAVIFRLLHGPITSPLEKAERLESRAWRGRMVCFGLILTFGSLREEVVVNYSQGLGPWPVQAVLASAFAIWSVYSSVLAYIYVETHQEYGIKLALIFMAASLALGVVRT